MGLRNKILGWSWGAPNTLAGLLLALLAGCKYHGWYDGLTVWVAPRHGLLYSKFFVPKGIAGFCWGCTVIVRSAPMGDSIRLVAHEARHAIQSTWYGPFFVLAYGVASLAAKLKGNDAYRDNWFEKDAVRYSDLVWAKFLRSGGTWMWREGIF